MNASVNYKEYNNLSNQYGIYVGHEEIQVAVLIHKTL